MLILTSDEMEPQNPCLINCELFGKRGAFFESAIVPLWREVYDSLVARARVIEGSRALDVGTGSGEIALRLARMVGKGEVVAIDAEPTMLKLAADKARRRGVRNVKFEQMSMQEIDFSRNSFDSVLGNYSLCCCTDYRAALVECLKVLKPGGRLTYNHGGPADPLPNQVLVKVFEQYKTKTPSRKLREFRKAKEAQVEAFTKYRDPFTTLGLLRNLGYAEAEATLTRSSLSYPDAASFVEEWMSFDWAPEAEEMSPRDLTDFKKTAVGTLSPLSRGPKFVVERDVVYFTGLKR